MVDRRQYLAGGKRSRKVDGSPQASPLDFGPQAVTRSDRAIGKVQYRLSIADEARNTIVCGDDSAPTLMAQLGKT